MYLQRKCLFVEFKDLRKKFHTSSKQQICVNHPYNGIKFWKSKNIPKLLSDDNKVRQQKISTELFCRLAFFLGKPCIRVLLWAKSWATGCSLNIVLFLKILNCSGLLPFSVFPRSQRVYTHQAGRTPALQQNWQSSEKSQNFKEKHNI